MIGYLKGEVKAKGEDFLVVAPTNVGYKVYVTQKLIEKKKVGDEVELFTETVLGRDKLNIYGLSSSEKMEFFKFLSGISGIGGKTALSLARFDNAKKLKEAIEKRGSQVTKKIKGVGPKKMKRVLLEITGRVKELDKKELSEKKEARKALVSLGFSRDEVEQVLLELPDGVDDPEEMVEESLKKLGEKK